MGTSIKRTVTSTPVHMTTDSGYFDSHVNTYCNLGDGYDRGFKKGTTNWAKVTWKKCLKQKPNKLWEYHYHLEKENHNHLKHQNQEK